MSKSLHRCALVIVSIAMSACASAKPYLYGEGSCPGGAPYPTANGAVVVCLSPERAAYLLCVRELGLQSNSRDTSDVLSVSASGENVGNASLDGSQKQVLSQVWASQGDLLKARADALRACVGMLPAKERQTASCNNGATTGQLAVAPQTGNAPSGSN